VPVERCGRFRKGQEEALLSAYPAWLTRNAGPDTEEPRAKRKAPPTRRWSQLVAGGWPYSQYGYICQGVEPDKLEVGGRMISSSLLPAHRGHY